MLFKQGNIKKSLLVTLFFAAFFILMVGFLAIRNISIDDPRYLVVSQKLSKAIVMRMLDQFESHFGPVSYAPTPFDSPGFKYADLSHPYYERIRNDRRVSQLYPVRNHVIDLSEALAMKEYLRNLFPHGTASKDYMHINVLEMIDAAEKGEKFLCGDISKMLVQLIQAGGTQARTVGLQASHSGHVVVELWSDIYNKWIVLDPDYNVHYTGAAGVPLSAIELFLLSQDETTMRTINPIPGGSPNTLYKNNSNLLEVFYKNGIAVYYYNRWIGKDFQRRNPARSPVIMGFYIGHSTVERLYYKHDRETITEEISNILYTNPSRYNETIDRNG